MQNARIANESANISPELRSLAQPMLHEHYLVIMVILCLLCMCIQHSNFQFLFIVLATTSASSQAMKGVLKLLVFGFVLFMAPVESAQIPGSMYL